MRVVVLLSVGRSPALVRFEGLGAALLQINLCQFGELGTALPRIGSVGGPGASFKKSPDGVRPNTVLDLGDSQNGPIPTTVGNMSTERPPDATVAEDGVSIAAPAVTPVAGGRPLTPSAVTITVFIVNLRKWSDLRLRSECNNRLICTN